MNSGNLQILYSWQAGTGLTSRRQMYAAVTFCRQFVGLLKIIKSEVQRSFELHLHLLRFSVITTGAGGWSDPEPGPPGVALCEACALRLVASRLGCELLTSTTVLTYPPAHLQMQVRLTHKHKSTHKLRHTHTHK